MQALLRPRLTDYVQMSLLVTHLRRTGVTDSAMAARITEIGAVDLDMLTKVMRSV